MAIQTFELENLLRPRGVSKHRQFDDKGNWIPGRVRIADNSSLRKLMRAARRGMVSSERARTIVGAMMTSERGMVHRWQRVEASKRKVDEAQRKMIDSTEAAAS